MLLDDEGGFHDWVVDEPPLDGIVGINDAENRSLDDGDNDAEIQSVNSIFSSIDPNLAVFGNHDDHVRNQLVLDLDFDDEPDEDEGIAGAGVQQELPAHPVDDAVMPANAPYLLRRTGIFNSRGVVEFGITLIESTFGLDCLAAFFSADLATCCFTVTATWLLSCIPLRCVGTLTDYSSTLRQPRLV